MNLHYCRVGTIKPSLKKELIPKETENNSVKEKTVKTSPSSKLSK